MSPKPSNTFNLPAPVIRKRGSHAVSRPSIHDRFLGAAVGARDSESGIAEIPDHAADRATVPAGPPAAA